MAANERLDSWKEIARYLRCSVRTVRRWERHEGLPVHRHMHRTLARVFALRSEVDAWRSSHTRAARHPAPRAKSPAATRTIAVLPFGNLSTADDDEYFAAGLTEEIATALAQVRALRVTSCRSATRFKDRTLPARTVATQLGVRYLVTGSVRRADARLHLAAQLIDGDADAHLWGERYEGSVDDVFRMQERLARDLVAALSLRLEPQEERGLGERGIASLPAYECYLRARHESWRWRADSIEHAVRLLEEALRLVGPNARLYGALGLAHLQLREAGIDYSERPLIAAESCAQRLLALAPQAAAGLLLRGWLAYARGRVQEAVHDLEGALALEPDNADTLLLLGNCYLISGRLEAARALIARLRALDPLTPITRCMPAWADVLEGRFAAAVAPYGEMFAMDPANPMARLFYAWVQLLAGQAAEARSLVAAFPVELLESVPGRIARFLVLMHDGAPEQAQSLLSPPTQAAALASEVFARLIAQGYAWGGLAAPALQWLRRAADRGFINHPYLTRHDPCFARLRHTAEFAALAADIHERWRRFEVHA
jgi:TolB-like protein/Flp pilus assembly protein TadD